MSLIYNLVQLLRPKHYLKNFLVFLPLLFSGQLLTAGYVVNALYAFFAFCMAASVVYVVNDIADRKRDAQHPLKKNRPIASGRVSLTQAIILLVVVVGLCVTALLALQPRVSAVAFLVGYVAMNIAYSFGLKNVPILDVAILSLGFVMRVYFGGEAIGVEVSSWLYLAILAFSFYLGLGKRRNELIAHGSRTRAVNRFYSKDFLDKNMYVFLGLTVMYYSLWAIDPAQQHKAVVWTVPLVMVIVMTYSLAIENESSDGDPVEVLTHNKALLSLAALYGVLMLGLVYV